MRDHSDVITFLIDSKIEFAQEYRDEWENNLKRSVRMYPPRGGDVIALFDEFVAMLQPPPSSDWKIFTIADFAEWLKTRTLPTKDVIASRRAKQLHTGKVDLKDQKQRLLAERMAKVEAARNELPDMADMEEKKAAAAAELALAMQKDGPHIADAKGPGNVRSNDLAWGDEPTIPSNVIAPNDEDPLAGL